MLEAKLILNFIVWLLLRLYISPTKIGLFGYSWTWEASDLGFCHTLEVVRVTTVTPRSRLNSSVLPSYFCLDAVLNDSQKCPTASKEDAVSVLLTSTEWFAPNQLFITTLGKCPYSTRRTASLNPTKSTRHPTNRCTNGIMRLIQTRSEQMAEKLLL